MLEKLSVLLILGMVILWILRRPEFWRMLEHMDVCFQFNTYGQRVI